MNVPVLFISGTQCSDGDSCRRALVELVRGRTFADVAEQAQRSLRALRYVMTTIVRPTCSSNSALLIFALLAAAAQPFAKYVVARF